MQRSDHSTRRASVRERNGGDRMRLGITLRSMGPQATRDTIVACARAAESAGLDDVWVQDHVAIPPDDAEGSQGRYLDPLATLAYLSAVTERIGLGSGVLILPYRPPLPTAKWIATIQELSLGRLLLGVGIGWMKAEFRALGVPRSMRGRIADETLEFLRRCFADDVVESNGQEFLFRPRPERPPIYVGGAAPHALERAARYADGWMPMGGDPASLRAPIAELRALAGESGRGAPEVVLLTSFDVREPSAAKERVAELAEVGVTGLVHGARYSDAEAFARAVDFLAEHVMPELP
jgi:probable F420-dependent oxidoreductase